MTVLLRLGKVLKSNYRYCKKQKMVNDTSYFLDFFDCTKISAFISLGGYNLENADGVFREGVFKC